MAETIYATSGGYYDISKDALYSTPPIKAQKDMFRVVYTMPALSSYANARSMILHVYVSKSPANNTLTVMAGSSNTAYSSTLSASTKLVSVISSWTQITFDLSKHISAIAAISLPRIHITSSVSSESTYFGTATSELYKPYLEIEMSSGSVVHYCIDGVWKPCEAYFATGGKWVQCEARYGYQGAWKELGE
jgi:hypothetical protein